MKILAFFLLLLFSVSAPATDRLPLRPAGDTLTSGLDRNLLLKLVNDARTKGCKCGGKYFGPVAPLTWNEQLEKISLAHSRDMQRRKYFNHISPEGLGAGDRMEKGGYRWTAYGENIGMGYANEREMIEGWLASPGHCRNLMNADYREMGVARSGPYWTQTLGSR
jgi:uncharacterized protein YkwD